MKKYQFLALMGCLSFSTVAFAADEDLKNLVTAEEAAAIEKASKEKSAEKPVEEDASKDAPTPDEAQKESEEEQEDKKAEEDLARKELSRPYRTFRQGIEPKRQLTSPPSSLLGQ